MGKSSSVIESIIINFFFIAGEISVSMCNCVKKYNITMYLVNEHERKPTRKLSMDIGNKDTNRRHTKKKKNQQRKLKRGVTWIPPKNQG